MLILRDESRIPNSADAALVRLLDVTCPRTIHTTRKLQHFLAGPFRRVQPVISKFVQCFAAGSNRGLLGWCGLRKRKGFEASCRCVTGPSFQARTEFQSPSLM